MIRTLRGIDVSGRDLHGAHGLGLVIASTFSVFVVLDRANLYAVVDAERFGEVAAERTGDRAVDCAAEIESCRRRRVPEPSGEAATIVDGLSGGSGARDRPLGRELDRDGWIERDILRGAVRIFAAMPRKIP